MHVCEFAGRLSGAPSHSLSNNRIVCKWLCTRVCGYACRSRNRGPEEERPWGPACLTACFPAVARAQEDPVFLRSPLRIIATLRLPETARADFRRTHHVHAAINALIHKELNMEKLKREIKKGSKEPSNSENSRIGITCNKRKEELAIQETLRNGAPAYYLAL